MRSALDRRACSHGETPGEALSKRGPPSPVNASAPRRLERAGFWAMLGCHGLIHPLRVTSMTTKRSVAFSARRASLHVLVIVSLVGACGERSPDLRGQREGLGGPVAVIEPAAGRSHGPSHGILGIVWQANAGLTVDTVAPGSSAAERGLTGGDVVIGLDGHPVATPNDATERVQVKQPGESVTVEFVRGSESHSILVELMRYDDMVARLRAGASHR